MYRINIVLAFFIAVLCLGLSTRCNAQAQPNWAFIGAPYTLDKSSYTTVTGGGGAGNNINQPQSLASSAGHNASGYAYGVYNSSCQWQGLGLPGAFVYGSQSYVNGSAKDAMPGYPGNIPGSGASSTLVDALDGTCPANYSIPGGTDHSVNNPNKDNIADIQLWVKARATGNSCSTTASTTITSR